MLVNLINLQRNLGSYPHPLLQVQRAYVSCEESLLHVFYRAQLVSLTLNRRMVGFDTLYTMRIQYERPYRQQVGVRTLLFLEKDGSLQMDFQRLNDIQSHDLRK